MQEDYGVIPPINMYNYTSGESLPRQRGLQFLGPGYKESFTEMGIREGYTSPVRFGFGCTDYALDITGIATIQVIRSTAPLITPLLGLFP